MGKEGTSSSREDTLKGVEAILNKERWKKQKHQ
jgi:hypothetical protein